MRIWSEQSTREVDDGTVVSKTLVPLSLHIGSTDIVRGVGIDHTKHGGQLGIVKIIGESVRNTEGAAHGMSSRHYATLTKGERGNLKREFRPFGVPRKTSFLRQILVIWTEFVRVNR